MFGSLLDDDQDLGFLVDTSVENFFDLWVCLALYAREHDRKNINGCFLSYFRNGGRRIFEEKLDLG